MTVRILVAAVVCSMTATAAGVDTLAQTTGGTRPPLVIESMAGADLYEAYCASCHGTTGAGDGPTAPALRTPVPDLTSLARRAGGTFPAARVRSVLMHGESLRTPAHGSRDMPVWGPLFRALGSDDTRARVRIDAIVSHVATIQDR